MQEYLAFAVQHQLLVAVFIVVLLGLLIVESLRNKFNAQGLAAATVVKLINRDNAKVVDLRNADSYAQGHIVDAMSLPVADWQAKQAELDKCKDQPLVLVCGNGVESARYASQLKHQGKKQVYYLAGGIQGWKEVELPLVKK